MAVNERETQESLYPKNHPYSSASAVGAPDEQDLLQAEVLDLRGRTQRAELRVEVLMRALSQVVEADVCRPSTARVSKSARADAWIRFNGAIERAKKVLEGGGP